MAIRFGLQIPSFTFPRRAGENVFEVTRDIALRAEAAGFDSIWLMDHLFQIPAVAPETDPILDCWTGLAALAASTKRVRLGTLVAAASFRPPSLLAKTTASVDVISGGRLVVGLGAGWCDWEHRAYGLDFPPLARRLKRLEDTIRVLRCMWTEERASYEGVTFAVAGAVNSPKPVQRPHPPILIGGTGARVTLRLTARYAQAHNVPGGSARECARVLGILERHCEDLGTDFGAIEKTRLTPILFGDDEADARARAERLRPAGETAKGFAARTLIGTPERIAERLQGFVDTGIETFIVSFWDLDEIEPLTTLMGEVAPRLVPRAA